MTPVLVTYIIVTSSEFGAAEASSSAALAAAVADVANLRNARPRLARTPAAPIAPIGAAGRFPAVPTCGAGAGTLLGSGSGECRATIAIGCPPSLRKSGIGLTLAMRTLLGATCIGTGQIAAGHCATCTHANEEGNVKRGLENTSTQTMELGFQIRSDNIEGSLNHLVLTAHSTAL